MLMKKERDSRTMKRIGSKVKIALVQRLIKDREAARILQFENK